MARNEEKAMAMLNRWVKMKRGLNTKAREKRPNDTGSVSVEAFVKIFDPKTRKVFVEQKS